MKSLEIVLKLIGNSKEKSMLKKLITGISIILAIITFIIPSQSEACGRRGYYGGGYRRPSYSGYRVYVYPRPIYYGSSYGYGNYGGYRGRYW